LIQYLSLGVLTLRSLSSREWKVLLIMSMVVPVGLLTTFRLTGILEEPATIAETITLEAVQWEFERPTCVVHFGDNIESSYFGDVSINQTVFVDDYWPDACEYGGSPILKTNLSLTTALAEGHVESINVTFLDEYVNSTLSIPDLGSGGKKHTRAVWDNLVATAYRHRLQGVEKAFVNLESMDYPKMVYLRICPTWILRSPHNQTQRLTIRNEVTYFNGTSYKKVVQAFQLKLITEDNNNFETAEEISPGRSERHVLGGDDRQDFYKVYLTDDETVNITLTPSYSQNLDLYLYSPVDKINPVANSTHTRDVTEHITYKIDFTGWWFIKVQHDGGGGIYTLTTTTLTEGIL
jgi:hypothetical protein